MNEKEIKENLDENRRYLKNLLIECGFFKIEKVELTEKEKMNHADYKILQYSKEDINRLLDFIIFLKNDEDNKIIINQVSNEKKEKELKRVNHYFYDNLLYPTPDTDIEKFMIVLLSEISKTEYVDEGLVYKFLKSKFFYENFVNICSVDIKKKVRTFFILTPKIIEKFKGKYDFIDIETKKRKIMQTLPVCMTAPYRDTYLDGSYILHFNNKKDLPIQLEEMFFRYYLSTTQLEFMQQMVVYDLFSENFSKLEREENYKKIYDFLIYKEQEIHKDIEEFFLNKKYINSKNIFIDFFCFLYIRHKIYFTQNGYDIGLTLRDSEKSKYIPPVDELLNFQYFLQKSGSLDSGRGYFLGKNVNIHRIKEILHNKKLPLLENSEIKKVLEGYQNNNKTLLEVYSQEKQKNNFKNIEENIDKILSRFNPPLDCSLQTRKGIIKFIEEDNIKLNLGSSKVTLKSLFTSDKYQEYWETETVKLNLRLRISRENFREKGKLDSFEYDMRIETLINKILFDIFSVTDSLKQNELIRKFLLEYQSFYIKLMKSYRFASLNLELDNFLKNYLEIENTINSKYGDNDKIINLINNSKLAYNKE